MMKKIPMTKEQHEECANDIRDILNKIGKWKDVFYKSFSVNGKEVRMLNRADEALRIRLRDRLDEAYFSSNKTIGPYYKGKE